MAYAIIILFSNPFSFLTKVAYILLRLTNNIFWGCCSCELDSLDLPEPSSLAFSTVIVSSVLKPGFLAVKVFLIFESRFSWESYYLSRCASNILYFAIFFSLSRCFKDWVPVIFSADVDLLQFGFCVGNVLYVLIILISLSVLFNCICYRHWSSCGY